MPLNFCPARNGVDVCCPKCMAPLHGVTSAGPGRVWDWPGVPPSRMKCHRAVKLLLHPRSLAARQPSTRAQFQLGQWFVQQTSLGNRVRRIRRSAATTLDDQKGGQSTSPLPVYVCVCFVVCFCLVKYGCIHCKTESQNQAAASRQSSSAAAQSEQAEQPTQGNPLPVRFTVLRRVLRAQQRKMLFLIPNKARIRTPTPSI